MYGRCVVAGNPPAGRVLLFSHGWGGEGTAYKAGHGRHGGRRTAKEGYGMPSSFLPPFPPVHSPPPKPRRSHTGEHVPGSMSIGIYGGPVVEEGHHTVQNNTGKNGMVELNQFLHGRHKGNSRKHKGIAWGLGTGRRKVCCYQ